MCIVDLEFELHCWGWNLYGQCEDDYQRAGGVASAKGYANPSDNDRDNDND